jgi:CheY-like chemotaxis protein
VISRTPSFLSPKVSHPSLSNVAYADIKLVDNLVAQRLRRSIATYHNTLTDFTPVSRQLKNLGFIVTASSNGLEAVDRSSMSLSCWFAFHNSSIRSIDWLAHPPGYFKVALFDHHMPLSDGLSAARRIRSLEKEKNVKVVHLIATQTMSAHDFCRRLSPSSP